MRFLYIAPRCHNNQMSILKGLVERGHEVCFISHYQGLTEDYSYVKPVVLGYSSLYRMIDFLYVKVIRRKDGVLHLQQLAMNVLSIHMPKGLYVLAYRKLNLDVKQRILRPEEEMTICTEFTMGGTKQSIRRYLDADEYELLHDFEGNQEKIKDCIMRRLAQHGGSVDDMPYVIGLEADIALDLHREYESIIKMYQRGEASVPIRAFFGDLLERPRKKAAYPIALINQRINMDQLLAIHNAMKYPLAYIQGPPGTGKTNTIMNTIVTAFFNERTVLFASYNNHPINGVYEKLSEMEYRGKKIPFPILRVGGKKEEKKKGHPPAGKVRGFKKKNFFFKKKNLGGENFFFFF